MRNIRTLLCVGLLTLSLAPALAQPGRTLLRKDTRFLDAPGKEQFPSANAIIVYDDIGFEIMPDSSTAYTEHDAVKILTPEAVEDQGRLVRVYRKDEAELKLEVARTILPDGTVVDVAPDKITDQPLMPGSKLYADFRRFDVEFPRVEPGAIIEFRLVTRRKPHVADAWWATSYVQNPEPMLISIFHVTAPRDLKINWSAPGLLPSRPARTESDGRQVLRWEVKDQTPLRDEPAMPQSQDLLRRVDVSSFATWDELGKWYAQAWSERVVPSERLNMVTAGILPTAATPRAKAEAILSWVRSHKKQVDLSYEQLLPNPPGTLLDEPVLSTWDTASLLAGMLKFAGFEVEPVLGFTMPAEDMQHQLPRPPAVSRVLLHLPGPDWWIDPAHPGELLDGPPSGFQGSAGIRLASPPYALADLAASDHAVNRDDTRIEARVDESGAAELAISKEQFGESALFLREAARALQAADRTRREQVIRSLFQALAQSFSPLAQVHDRYFPESAPAGAGPFSIGATLLVPDFAASGDNNTLSVPVPLQFDQRIAGLAESPADRQHPMQFDHPFQDDSRVHLLLPPGSEIVSMPEPVSVENEYLSFLLTSRKEGPQAWFYSRLVVKRPWIPTSAYPQVMQVARAVARVNSTPLVYRPAPENAPAPEKAPSTAE